MQADFEVKLRAGLRPAPTLRVMIKEILDIIRVTHSATFNCLQLTTSDVAKNGAKVGDEPCSR